MNHIDQNGLYDIYPVWHIPFWQTQWFYWMIVGISLALCIAAVLLLYKWYRKKREIVTPPWDTALTIISQLQSKQYATQHDGKQCYFILTSTLKTYLHNRFNYPLAHKTDEEAANYLNTTELDSKLKKSAQTILRGCLFIKFANAHAVNEQIQEHLRLAEELVRETVPQQTDMKSYSQTT